MKKFVDVFAAIMFTVALGACVFLDNDAISGILDGEKIASLLPSFSVENADGDEEEDNKQKAPSELTEKDDTSSKTEQEDELLKEKALEGMRSAMQVELDTPFTSTFSYSYFEKFYAFVPDKNGFYDFTVDNIPEKAVDNVYVSVTNSDGDELGFSGVPDDDGRVKCVAKLKKGETYYMCLDCYVDYFNTVETTISRHKHTIVKEPLEEDHWYKYYCKDLKCGYSYISYDCNQTEIKGVSGILGRMIIRWTAVEDITGYEIQYSTDKDFKKPVKLTIDDPTKGHTIIKDLKGDTEYYVRMRTYYNYGRKTYKSDWTEVATVNM